MAPVNAVWVGKGGQFEVLADWREAGGLVEFAD